MYITGERLKQCPFCGAEGAMWEDYRFRADPEDTWRVYGAMCTNSDCIAHQEQKFYPTEDAARTAWNRRANVTYILNKEERK